MQESKNITTHKLDTATLGGGCFWCLEAVFQNLEGVEKVQSGYSGGSVKNPSYKEVCSGITGHAEVIQIVYDESKVSFKDILAAFFVVHDPTTLNKQGNDMGTQYRSVIYFHNDNQKQIAEDVIAQLNNEHAYDGLIVTEVSPFQIFYIAEDYHQNYFNDNKSQPYCAYVIQPKVDKFKKVFGEKIKK